MNHYLKTFLLGIGAGLAIALGGLANLALSSIDSPVGKIFGALLFSIGLLTVCSFGFFLYTGKIGYLFEMRRVSYLFDLLFGLLGNIIGAVVMGYICYLIPSFRDGAMGTIAKGIAEKRNVLSGEAWYEAVLLGFICGIFVFLAVDLFKNKPGIVGTLALVFGVFAFVIIGSEHCIANMFYFSAANGWNGGTLLNILLVLVGNSFGSLFFKGIASIVTKEVKRVA